MLYCYFGKVQFALRVSNSGRSGCSRTSVTAQNGRVSRPGALRSLRPLQCYEEAGLQVTRMPERELDERARIFEEKASQIKKRFSRLGKGLGPALDTG